MDVIHIKDLEIWAYHGVLPEENRLGQKFVVSCELYTDLRMAGMTDDLNCSVNYAEVCETIQRVMTRETVQLIETVAERIAAAVLREYPLVRRIWVEVKKPWAPVGMPLSTVSVELERSWHRVFIALGSNMGDTKGNLDLAIGALSSVPGCRMKQVAPFIETEPYGVTDQPVFLNSVCELETLLTPEELLELLHSIEAEAGRERVLHWGPRTLDLDILFYDDLIMDTPELIIPHIEIPLRSFVLEPMNAIAPGFVHPVLKRTMRDLLRELQ